MSLAQFPHLFSPLDVGGMRMANRILSTGHDTSLGHGGHVTDQLIAYHTARARGGAGLIVSQVASVHATALYSSHVLRLDDDRYIDGFARLAAAVHAHDTRIIGQLFHPGREVMEGQDGTIPPAYAPSAVPNERFHLTPIPLSLRLIDEIVEGYAAAGRRYAAAGYDGAEIVASHGYLPAQFLNPRVNLRTDRYGGALENRARFLLEVIAAIRAEVPAGFVLGLRITGDERDSDTVDQSEVLRAVECAVAQGGLDYVNVIAGTSASYQGAIHIVPPMVVTNAYVAPFAAAMKKTVAIPVFVAGRINQPQIAEGVIARGEADACGMTRAMIADPLMPAKAKNGRADDIRACIACNQACIGHFHKGYGISCIQHPETGRELEFGDKPKAARRRKVIVAGGGPAGLKAAAVAAERGHRVTVFEAGRQLGGQVLLAQLLPGRAEFGGLATNLARECELAGVHIECGVSVDRALIDRDAPDAVIVATGGKPRWPAIEGRDDAHVVDAWQVLRGEANVGKRVVVADWRPDWVGVGIALKLAADGCTVRLAVQGLHAGELMPWYVRDHAAGELHKAGVQVFPYARLYGVDADTAYFQHAASGEPMVLDGVDTLVLAQGNERVATLEDALADWSGEVHVIGDALTPRTAEEAVFEGLKAGMAV